MRSLAKAHLDMSEPFSQQDQANLTKVYKKVYNYIYDLIFCILFNCMSQAREKHNVLTNYKDNWVEIDFLSTILKNSSVRAKRKPVNEEDDDQRIDKSKRNTDRSNKVCCIRV